MKEDCVSVFFLFFSSVLLSTAVTHFARVELLVMITDLVGAL
jgi:hypothetical protein